MRGQATMSGSSRARGHPQVVCACTMHPLTTRTAVPSGLPAVSKSLWTSMALRPSGDVHRARRASQRNRRVRVRAGVCMCVRAPACVLPRACVRVRASACPRVSTCYKHGHCASLNQAAITHVLPDNPLGRVGNEMYLPHYTHDKFLFSFFSTKIVRPLARVLFASLG
jgi:hypothetical protein